ncbi:unnamed protein product, partial [Aureobasidium uvarum]
SLPLTARAMPTFNWQCFAPVSDPGNHGSDSLKSLQVAPFQAQSNSVWIGYHDQPSKKYLGVFPSFDDVVERCRRNVRAGSPNTSFPLYNKRIRDGRNGDISNPESHTKHVCCTACQDQTVDSEKLNLEFIPVKTGSMNDDSRKNEVYLIVYKFYLRGEQMIALLHYAGKHRFQKTDGTLSKVFAFDSRHGCNEKSQSTTPSESEDGSDSSSLTQFDCVEDEDMARKSPRVSLRSSQRHDFRDPATTVVRTPRQTSLLPQQLPAQPRSRGRVVIDMTDEDEPSPVKQEHPEYLEHTIAPIPYKTPSATPATTPSLAPSEDISFTNHFGPDPLAEEYGRITTQIFQEYSMRVFALPEVTNLIQRMKQAVKAGDRPALCRAYGALQAFLITVE